MKYVTLRDNTYYYRRSIPASISHLSDINRIYRPLSKDMELAIAIATKYDALFDLIDASLKLGREINDYINELNLQDKKTNHDIYSQYLKSQDVSDSRMNKIKRHLSVIKVLLPNDLKRLNMSILDGIRAKIIGLPKRNKKKYRVMTIEEILRAKIPTEELLTVETANDYIKILNQVLKFAYDRDLISKLYNVSPFKSTVAARDQRQVLNDQDISKLLSTKKNELKALYKISYYSGLRLSEVHKCKLTVIDGIKCFDLTDRSILLKTQSSYRIVPVHKEIEEDIENMLVDARSMTDKYVTRTTSEALNIKGKTLYSLRHTFATRLASSNVETTVLSELLGHTHKGMTMGRYVKGFSIKLLSEAVNKLEPV